MTDKNDDASRRDVLQAVAALGVAPGIPNDRWDPDVNVPDLSPNSPYWVVLYAASQTDDPDAAVRSMQYVIELLSPRSMDVETAREYVVRAVRGEYDEDVLEREAADAWEMHRSLF